MDYMLKTSLPGIENEYPSSLPGAKVIPPQGDYYYTHTPTSYDPQPAKYNITAIVLHLGLANTT